MSAGDVLHNITKLTGSFLGSGNGGMYVRLVSKDKVGVWNMYARDLSGPCVPCLPALLVAAQACSTRGLPAGAGPCEDLFDYPLVESLMKYHDIETSFVVKPR